MTCKYASALYTTRHMSPLLLSVLAVGLISVVSLVGAFTLSFKESFLKKVLFFLIALAAGALLGDAFIHLIPEAFHEAESSLAVSLLILLGILSFFVLEKFLHWHHSHGEEEFSENHARIHPLGHLVLVSDGIHNFIDGLVIGIAFIVSPEVGIATTLAIALHEIPQEIGDFGLLIHAGFSRMKALAVNFASALLAFFGLIVAFTLAEVSELAIPLIAAFAAGNFIYIALADLVPELQKTTGVKKTGMQLLALFLGLSIMVGLMYVEAPHHEDELHEEEVH